MSALGGVYLVPGGCLLQGGVPGPRGCLLGGCLLWGGVSGPQGGEGVCTWSQGVSAPGVCLVQGGVCSRGVPGLGVSAPRGCTWSRGVPGQVLPPVDRHTPLNILPCPKLHLRAVTRLEGCDVYIVVMSLYSPW